MKFGHIYHIDEQSPIPGGNLRNCIVHSKVRTYDRCNTTSSSVSIKSVQAGVERYRLNKVDYKLGKGEFIIVDEGQELDIAFREEHIAEGFCFYLDKELFTQAIALLIHGEDKILDDPEFVHDSELLSVKHKNTDGALGDFILSVSDIIQEGRLDELDESFFPDLAWVLAGHHRQVTGTVNRISAVKTATRIELYKRAMLVRDHIEGQLFDQKLSISQLAREAALSEVQLHRVFKKVFATTPYQYILNRKMEKAMKLLEEGSIPIYELSQILGFPDTPTFSKLFKKTFGYSPSRFHELN